MPQILLQREPEAKESSSWKEVSELIGAERALDGPNVPTGIVYGGVQNHPIASARVIAYTYPEGFADTVDLTIDTPAAETGRLWETRTPLAANLDRVENVDVIYLVASFSRDIRPAQLQAVREIVDGGQDGDIDTAADVIDLAGDRIDALHLRFDDPEKVIGMQ